MYSLIKLVSVVFKLYTWLVIGRVLLSWVPHNRYHPVVGFIYKATEPILKPFRGMFGYGIGIDISPIIALLALQLVEMVIINILKMI
ncbi:MAG: YggT family protein [Clostridia bacterium]|nr:YggT family protein [Clostridia bacterium]MDD4047695.1 YggT family protein [Clostridia bacterium]